MSRKAETTWGGIRMMSLFVLLDAARRRVLGRNQANAARRRLDLREGARRRGHEARSGSDVKSLLRQRHRLQPGQEDDFTVRNLADIAATREASARTLALAARCRRRRVACASAASAS